MSRTDLPAPVVAVSPVLTAVAGIALLCAMDAVMKHVVVSTHPITATFGRFIAGAMFTLPLWMANGRPQLTREVLRAHALRGAVMAFSATSFFWALTVLPLAEAITISFIAPLIIPFIAWALLEERPRPTSLVAGAAGFIGVLVATQGAPEAADTPQRTLGIIVMLAAAAAWALSLVLLRGRAERDGPAIVTFMGTVMPAIVLSPLALAVGEVPSGEASLWLLLAAALATGGVWLLTKAYARAQAQVLAPLEFTALVWATLLGWLFFTELPRVQVFVGASIIIAACLLAAWDERRGSGVIA